MGRMLGRRIRYGKLKEGKQGVREPLAEDHVLLGVLEQAPCGGSLGARPSVWYLEPRVVAETCGGKDVCDQARPGAKWLLGSHTTCRHF